MKKLRLLSAAALTVMMVARAPAMTSQAPCLRLVFRETAPVLYLIQECFQEVSDREAETARAEAIVRTEQTASGGNCQNGTDCFGGNCQNGTDCFGGNCQNGTDCFGGNCQNGNRLFRRKLPERQ